MALACDDRESPSQMMRFGAVVGNCVLLSAVVAGGFHLLSGYQDWGAGSARLWFKWPVSLGGSEAHEEAAQSLLRRPATTTSSISAGVVTTGVRWRRIRDRARGEQPLRPRVAKS